MMARGLVGLIALLHVWFLVLEMFLWRKPLGLKTFGMDAAQAEATALLAANQGLYNGFLAAGLVWGLLVPEPTMARSVLSFFLACVVIAGLYGGFSVKGSILLVQAVPAALAIIALYAWPG